MTSPGHCIDTNYNIGAFLHKDWKRKLNNAYQIVLLQLSIAASFQRAFKSETKSVQKNCRNIMSPSMSSLGLVK